MSSNDGHIHNARAPILLFLSRSRDVALVLSHPKLQHTITLVSQKSILILPGTKTLRENKYEWHVGLWAILGLSTFNSAHIVLVDFNRPTKGWSA